MCFDFKNRIIVVTGATRGIGKRIANDLQEANATLILTGTKLSEINILNKKSLDNITWKCVDFNNEKQFREFLNYLSGLNKIDVLINNAGINYKAPIIEYPLNEFDKIINVNLRSPFRLMQTVIPKMHSGGKIVNIASILGEVGLPGRGAYAASKSGLISLTRIASLEHAKDNILINCVSPGITNTELTDSILGKAGIQSIKNKIPLKKLASVDDISNAILFLISQNNNYITGTNLIIDGGYTIW